MNNTSITQNTIDLQEILNTVENLPEAGSGGGVAVQSDYTQNDSTQPDYIKNRPFYREGYSYKWDGKATDETKKVGGSEYYYYKISDNVMTFADLVGAKVTTSVDANETIAESSIKTYDNGSFAYLYYKGLWEFILVCVETASYETTLGLVELTPGLWFLNSGIYARQLEKVTIKQIDNEFIPKATAIDNANADLPVTAGLLKTELENKADLVSPTIEVSPIEGGHTVSITDASGTPKSFDVLDGTSVTHSWEGTFLTITSAIGQSDPVDLKGEKGDPFEYEDFTEDQLKALKPVKDVDYFDGEDYILTDADKIEIANKTKGLLDETVQEMREIASGKCKADAFDTVKDMTTWLSDTNNTANLKLGDVFYIRAVDVPDYWWEPIVDDVELSKYTEKDVIISGIGAARILETTKVALEDYALIANVPNIKVNSAANADTIGGKQIVVSNEAPDPNGEDNQNIITIVI